jgi:hypothetical protein
MSVAVPIPELAAAIARYSWCYVVTVSDAGRAHLVALTPQVSDGVLTAEVGRSTVANASARPDVVLVFPPLDHAGMSLIVDATFETADPFTLRPTSAVLHRAAPT